MERKPDGVFKREAMGGATREFRIQVAKEDFITQEDIEI